MSAIPTHRGLTAPGFLRGPHESPPPAVEEVPKAAPPAPGERMPPGGALADLLAAELPKHGWSVEYRWTTYQGHALDARRGEHRYDVEVRLLDSSDEEDGGHWLITAKRRTGFFKRVFKGGVDPAEHELLRRAIDAVLAADPRSSESPREPWLDEEAWVARGEGPPGGR